MKNPNKRGLILEFEQEKQRISIPREYFLYGWTERDIFKRKLLSLLKKKNHVDKINKM